MHVFVTFQNRPVLKASCPGDAVSYFAELTLNLRFVQSALLLGHMGQPKGGIISSTTSFQVLPPLS